MRTLRRAICSIAFATVSPVMAFAADIIASDGLTPKPDKPIGFGYKTNWLAIKSNNPAEVIAALSLTDVKASTWQSGVRTSYAFDSQYHSTAVFVTPSIKGWVLVTGKALPYPECSETPAREEIRNKFQGMFIQLAHKFDQVQFFGTYRVVGFDSWGRAQHGKIERLFSLIDGEVCFNVGRQTVEEHKLGFLDLGKRDPHEATAFIFREPEVWSAGKRSAIPNEEDTAEIAAAWSIDPDQLDKMPLKESLGFVGTLPKSLLY